MLRKVPDRYGNFGVKGEILVEVVENDGLIEKIFRDKEIRILGHAERSTIGMQLQGEMDFIEGIGDNLVFDDTVLVDDPLEVDPDFDLVEITQLQTFHLYFVNIWESSE